MKHVVMFSGGIGSWMAAKRVAEKHGTEGLYLVFSDVKGRHADNPHLGEDEDTYRFLEEAAADVGGTFVHLSEGRSIWEVFRDDRFLGNPRLANCSKFLKQRPARAWLDENCDPKDTTVYVGIDWTETHRIPAIERSYAPYPALAPLTEAPYLDKDEMIAECMKAGIFPPRAYEQGYPHNNCGGFCVRAGQGQFKKLLAINPERYLFHEKEEQKLREHLGKDVAILRDRRGGKVRPMTMKEFRERQGVMVVDDDDLGGCGCFVEDNE